MQQALGGGYFAQKLIFFLTKADKQVITLCIWPEHIPYVFPPADYYMIIKKYRKFFRTVEESGIISSKTLHHRFGFLLDDYDFKNCKIMHPANAAKAEKLFDSISFEHRLEDFAERLPVEKIANVVAT